MFRVEVENPTERIDPPQWEAAVERTDGPQLVVSGPGGGKTEFLVRRALHLISDVGVRPESLMLLSFSRRSARDLRRRIEGQLEGSFTEVPASTFHSLAARLLEAYAPSVLGWERVPTLLTGPEHVELVADLLRDEDPGRWPVSHRRMLETATFAAEVADFVQRSRELMVGADDLRARVAQRPQWRGLDAFIERHDARLTELGRIDYGALQLRAVELLADEGTAAELSERSPYILVDELQDTTPAQGELLRQLYRRHRNLTATGDPYQSIYSFRGADPTNLTEFATRYPAEDGSPGMVMALTTSFRVRSDVLRAAERVTAGGDIVEVAGPVSPAPGPSSVEAYSFSQQSQEAEWIAGEVERIHLAEGVPYRRMAVLVRTKRRLLSELSRALERRRIPHDRPDTRSIDQPAVRVVADIVVAATSSGEEQAAAIQRVLLGPLYSVTLAQMRELQREATRRGTSWVQLLEQDLGEAADLANLLAEASWATEVSATEGFWHLWSSLDRFSRFASGPDPEPRRALASLSQVLSRVKERDRAITLAQYVDMMEREEFEALPLLGHRDPGEDQVVLTTMHQAKGLEFEVVFIADATEGVLPDLRARDTFLDTRLLDERQPEDPAAYARQRLQEEMRLAYTAMCRAGRRVVWTATDAGVSEDHGPPSRFMVLAVPQGIAPPPPAPPALTLTGRVAAWRRTLRELTADPVDRLAALGAIAASGAMPAFAHGSVAPGPDTGVVYEGMRLSPSQAEVYELCPRRYVLERRLQLGESSTHHLLFGSLIHDVLEDTEHEVLGSERHGTLDRALHHLNERFDPVDFGGEPWATAWKQRGVALLEHLYLNWPESSEPAVALERELELTIGQHSWTGKADRIESAGDGARIVDYKTSKSAKKKDEAAASLQLAFYALATAADPELGAPIASAELWYPAVASKSVTVRSLDLAQLDDLRVRLDDMADGITSERWDPQPGQHCDRCRVKPLCPAWPEGTEAFA